MAEPHQGLPPLEWIRVFEAAARLGSFTAAAQELGLTQAAVSQRIRHLELRLGAQLFTRQARGVLLSTLGEAWLPQVQAAFALLGHSAANHFAMPRRKITIAASASVIELWIVPRLAQTAHRLPHVQIVFETVHNLPDYERSDADFEIRFGEGRWLGREARRLFQEELAPVSLRPKCEDVNRVRFTRQACEDLLNIWSYIAPRSSEAVADQIYDRIEKRCQLLKEHPQLGPARDEIAEDARVLVVDRWLALYRLIDDGAQVVRIVDGSRDLSNLEWPLE